MSNIQTRIVSAFPGTGKSYYCNYDISQYDPTPYGYCIDIDSSKFDKNNFPTNYIEHIKSNIGKHAIIFVSSHKVVRDALVAEGIPFTLVYPTIEQKHEYIQRYRQRGNDEKFITLVESNWYNWIVELGSQNGCDRIILKSGEYISNVM